MTQSPDPLLAQEMHLAWVISCSRCSEEQAVHTPDETAVAATFLQDEGWTAEVVENTAKHTMAPITDTSDWPDTRVYVRCPWCSGKRRG